jgi:hypothetical protein
LNTSGIFSGFFENRPFHAFEGIVANARTSLIQKGLGAPVAS